MGSEAENIESQSFYDKLSVKDKLIWEADHQDSFNQKMLKVMCINQAIGKM